MDNVRFKWASSPCQYKPDTRNDVLLSLWLCSLRAYLFWSTLLFPHFAIIFSWADITLKFSCWFCPRGKFTKTHWPSALAFILMRLCILPATGLMFTFWLEFVSPSLGFGVPFPLHHHLYVSTSIRYQPEVADGTKDSYCVVFPRERKSSTFMFMCSSEFLLVWCLWLPGA